MTGENQTKKTTAKNQRLGAIFANAINGCRYAFRSQRNFKIHLFFSLLVFGLAFWLEISLEKWLFLALAVAMGWTVEMANTAFEKTIDLVTQEWHPIAKIVKDVSAGMMLILALMLAVVGLVVLGPSLWQKLSLFL